MTISNLNILAFFAHPDDETMLCGGTLALLTNLGARVHLVIATRGEGGEMGEPPLCTREELGQVREAELRCAAQALGASSLILLDYLDPVVGPDDQLFPFTENLEELVHKLIEEIRKTGSNVLLCHGINGEYGHPAHKLAHQAAALAVKLMGDQAPLFYGVMGNYEGSLYPRLMNADAPAHLVIDVAPFLEQKIAAAICHQTQHALFVRRRSEEAGRILTVPEVILAEESLTRISPPVDDGVTDGEVHDLLADVLWQSGYARKP